LSERELSGEKLFEEELLLKRIAFEKSCRGRIVWRRIDPRKTDINSSRIQLLERSLSKMPKKKIQNLVKF
jgi:hypothetical protein